MGLFSFVKDAGSKLFGHPVTATVANSGTTVSVPGTTNATTSTPDAPNVVVPEVKDENTVLTEAINALGLQATSLSVEFNKDNHTATIYGTVMTTADKEKVVLTVGNHEGVETVDDQLSVMNPEPESTFYQVKPGDTLTGIAYAMYGHASKYKDIFNANQPMLKNPDDITAGQMLRIPAMPA